MFRTNAYFVQQLIKLGEKCHHKAKITRVRDCRYRQLTTENIIETGIFIKRKSPEMLLPTQFSYLHTKFSVKMSLSNEFLQAKINWNECSTMEPEVFLPRKP